MPCIIDILAPFTEVGVIVVDGYVWLAKDRPGLGAHLYNRLAGRVPVVGVAKTAFRGNDCAIQVTRGFSTHPLYVTSIGIDPAVAAASVAAMAGPHRLPTILKRVDQLARGISLPVTD
ncbi:MAG: hypothetical protein FWD68_06490 [Alphaproteobacteria bacterium]|nr:hypothetical protein [Alphaproteobacteria bacterium]